MGVRRRWEGRVPAAGQQRAQGQLARSSRMEEAWREPAAAAVRVGAAVGAAAAWKFDADYYAKVGTSHCCRVTKRAIARGSVRLLHEDAPTGVGGQHIKYYWWLEGIAVGLSIEKDPGLRRAVDRGVVGLQLLDEGGAAGD